MSLSKEAPARSRLYFAIPKVALCPQIPGGAAAFFATRLLGRIRAGCGNSVAQVALGVGLCFVLQAD